MCDVVHSSVKRKKIRKQSFQFRGNNENGLLLQVQYLVKGPGGDVECSQFLHSSFSKNGERLAVIDHKYTVFIIDFSQKMFWHLTSVQSCTFLTFCQASDDLLIGLTCGNLLLFDCETGQEIVKLIGHKNQPTMYSFSSDGNLCLTAAPMEGIIWDMQTRTPAHCLILQPNTTITQVLFIPVLNHILASFQDNVIHVWQLGSFECINQVIPDAWQGKHICSIAFTRNGRAMVLGGESVQLVVFMMDDWTAQKVIELPEAFEGVLKVEFISDLFDGGANKMLAVLGTNGDMCFLDLECAQPVSKFMFHGVVNFACSASGKYMSCITTAGDVKIFSLPKVLNNRKSQTCVLPVQFPSETVQRTVEDRNATTKKQDQREESKDIVGTAEVQASKEQIAQNKPLSSTVDREIIPLATNNASNRNNEPPLGNVVTLNGKKDAAPKISNDYLPKKVVSSTRHTALQHLRRVDEKIEETLDEAKIQRILKEYGELPELYRPVIWRTILRLPNNIGVYRCLVERGTHPAWTELSQKYNFTNRSLLNTLQSVLSCLSHWCPAIAELSYVPLFVFPFIRFFHNNAFVCFEVVMTIIVNWCQHWFEFLSFPPLNVLAMVENVLAEYEPKVLNIFYDAGITTKLYAWSLLSTAFSEVLSPKEWQQLWDHVLCNPPWFLILAVVSYNACCRVALKTCVTQDDFEFFYHHQNPINMKQFINKTYELNEKISADNHPRQYIHPFEQLPKGNYPVLSGFPKFIVDYKNQQRNVLLREEEEILREEHELLELKLKTEEQHRNNELKNVRETRLRNLEEATKKAIEKEEQRLFQKRRELSALHAEIRNHEHQLISKAQAQMEEELSRQRCSRITQMQEKLESKSREADFQQQALFNEQKTQYSRLAALRRELQLRLENINSSEAFRRKDIANLDVEELVQQNARLAEKLREMQEANNKQRYSSSRKMSGKLAELNRRKEEKELATAEEALKMQDYLLNSQHIIEGANFDAKTRDLQIEIEKILKEIEITQSRRNGATASNGESSNQPRTTSAYDSQSETSSLKNSCSVRTNGSLLREQRLHRSEKTCRDRTEMPSSSGNLPPVRSEEFYSREKTAVNSAMDARAQLLARWR